MGMVVLLFSFPPVTSVYNWAGFKTKNTVFQAQGVRARATQKRTHQHILFLASIVKEGFFGGFFGDGGGGGGWGGNPVETLYTLPCDAW